MNIHTQHINEVLALYHIPTSIRDFQYLYKGSDEKTSSMKVIIKVNFANGNSLIMKMVKEKEHPHDVIEEQSIFSEYLRKHGVVTPKRYMSAGNYCITYLLEHTDTDVTVEDYLGDEIKVIDFRLAYKIGQLMAKIHNISEKGNCHINSNTIFNAVGDNDVSGYDTFVELGESGKIDPALYDKIQNIYLQKLEKIKLVWDDLPKYATQGDISINNLSYIGDGLGVFDYNIAGDEVLIGDIVLEGLLTAYEMDLAEGLSNTDRPEIFRCFSNGYIDERPLNVHERAVVDDIYSISFALWFTKIMYRENSLAKLVERNEHEKVILLLHDIDNVLSHGHIML